MWLLTQQVVYSAFVKHLRRNGNTMKQCISYLQTKRTCDLVRWEVLNNIRIEFGIPMELLRLIKMCLNETYSSGQVGKNMSDMFPIKYGLQQVPLLSILLLKM